MKKLIVLLLTLLCLGLCALGVSAATLSITTMSMAPDRTRASQISSACSPVSGWLT